MFLTSWRYQIVKMQVCKISL